MQNSTTFRLWEKEFRSAAAKDGLKLFRDHLKFLKLKHSPETLLEGTIAFVVATLSYLSIDGQRKEYVRFLELQKYNPSNSKNARFALTFDVCGRSCARLLVDSKFRPVDLADLYGHPWDAIGLAGFSSLLVSRTDGKPLTPAASRKLQKAIEYDIRFDYSEDEVTFRFYKEPRFLKATFRDV